MAVYTWKSVPIDDAWGYGKKLPKDCETFAEYDQLKEKEDRMTEKTLYEITRGDQVLYGHKLAINSLGEWVMEVKGTGEVLSVNKDKVQKVMPYTISVQYKEGGTIYSYFNEARDLKVDDFFINTATFDGGGQYQIGRVVAVDTKSESAKTEIKYFKKL